MAEKTPLKFTVVKKAVSSILIIGLGIWIAVNHPKFFEIQSEPENVTYTAPNAEDYDEDSTVLRQLLPFGQDNCPSQFWSILIETSAQFPEDIWQLLHQILQHDHHHEMDEEQVIIESELPSSVAKQSVMSLINILQENECAATAWRVIESFVTVGNGNDQGFKSFENEDEHLLLLMKTKLYEHLLDNNGEEGRDENQNEEDRLSPGMLMIDYDKLDRLPDIIQTMLDQL